MATNLYSISGKDEDDEDAFFLGKKSDPAQSVSTKAAGGGDEKSPLPGLPPPPKALIKSDEKPQATRIVERKIRNINKIVGKEENLSDDFLKTPWRIPSIEAAKDYKFSEVYRGGEANMATIELTSAVELGVGVRMYFQFAKSMMVAFGLMTFFSIPLAFFAMNGKGVAVQDQDLLGLYRFSLGNVGNPGISYSPDDFMLNSTYVSVYGYELSYGEMNLMITISECIQIIIFLIVIWHLKRRLKAFTNYEQSKDTVTITNYAVFVEGLPDDVTEVELVDHFSGLYPLDKNDWKRRPPVEDARTVQNCDNTGETIYINTWVAEVIIHRKIGDLIRKYRGMESMMIDLYRNRARMKMYGRGTSHEKGFNEAKYLKAEENMLRIAEKVDKYTQRTRSTYQKMLDKLNKKQEKAKSKKAKELERQDRKKKKGKQGKTATTVEDPMKSRQSSSANLEADLEDSLSKLEEGKGELQNGEELKEEDKRELGLNLDLVKSDPSGSTATHTAPNTRPTTPRDEPYLSPRTAYAKKAPVVGAFVCFEYNESFARCLDDYSKYSRFPYSLFYPQALKFRNRRLKVTKALEPDQIIWENLEISRPRKLFYLIRTIFLTCLIIVICFILILIASNSRFTFSSQIPTDKMCLETIPKLYAGNSHNYNTAYVRKMKLMRPPVEFQKAFDANCSAYISNSFFVVYSADNFYNPAANYSFEACNFLPYSTRQIINAKLTRPPSFAPTAEPSSQYPSSRPSASPSISPQPTNSPSSSKPTTMIPSAVPTFSPSTAEPTTAVPTIIPTITPTIIPSDSPTIAPSAQPTSRPTIQVRRGLRDLPGKSYDHSATIAAVTGVSDEINYDFGYCPAYDQPAYCPCITADELVHVSPALLPYYEEYNVAPPSDSKQYCGSIACQITAEVKKGDPVASQQMGLLETDSCSNYASETLAACHCKKIISDSFDVMTNLQIALDYLQFWKKVSPEERFKRATQAVRDEKYCQRFNSIYFLSYLISFGSVVIIVCINFLLKLCLNYFTRLERHWSLDAEQSSKLIKLFLSTYINTSVVILFAYGIKIRFNFEDITQISLSKGKYIDFIREWYGNNGFYIVTTVTITMLQPILSQYFLFYLVYPIRRYVAERGIKSKKGESIVMQYDLNRLQTGPIFLPTVHSAELLSILFITMTFAAGLPVLTPIAFIGFTLFFRMDKYFLGKFYRKPTAIDEAQMKTVIAYLPYAAILRILFGVWMFSVENMLPSNFPVHQFLFEIPIQTDLIKESTQGYLDLSYISMTIYRDFILDFSATYRSYIPSFLVFAYDRVLRMNTFPMLVLLVIIVLFLVLQAVWYLLPLKYVYAWYYRNILISKKKNTIFNNSRAKGYVHPFDLLITSQDPLRQEAAPYTGIYFQFINNKASALQEKKKQKKRSEGKENQSCCIRYFCCGCCCFGRKKSDEHYHFEDVENPNDVVDLDQDDPNDPNSAQDMTWSKWFRRTCCFCCRKKPNQSSALPAALPDIGADSKKADHLDSLMNDDEDENLHRRSKVKYHDRLDGWEVTDMGFDFEVKVKLWAATTNKTIDGITRLKGQHKRTYEVVSDFRCSTYHLGGIPNYSFVYAAIFAADIDSSTGTVISSTSMKQRSESGKASMVPPSRSKNYSIVSYYVEQTKLEEAHRVFNPDRVENELVEISEKRKKMEAEVKERRKNKIVPLSEEKDGEDDASIDQLVAVSMRSKKRSASSKSLKSNQSEEDQNENEGSEIDKDEEKAKLKAKAKPNKKRTFIIDEDESESESSEEEEETEEEESDEEEEEEEDDDDDDEDEDEEDSDEEDEEDEDDEDEEEEEEDDGAGETASRASSSDIKPETAEDDDDHV